MASAGKLQEKDAELQQLMIIQGDVYNGTNINCNVI